MHTEVLELEQEVPWSAAPTAEESDHGSEIVSHPFTITLIQVKAHQLCRRSDFSWSDADDLQQDMRLYLLEKAHLFDPERGNIEAFITQALNCWVAMRLRYRNRDKRRDSFKLVSLEATTNDGEGDLGGSLLEDDGRRRMQAAGVSPIEAFEQREAIAHVMQSLAPNDRVLLADIAASGVAGAMKKHHLTRRQVNAILSRLRPAFEEAGLGPG